MIFKTNINRHGRPADRRNEIFGFIHGRIISGKFGPGDKLPTRRMLQRKFNSSMATVQQAIDRLVGEGFLESRGIGGTFVVERPPHLNMHAVVVPAARLDDSVPLFWKTLADAFSGLKHSSGISFRHYYWPTEHGSTPETIELARNASNGSIAGMLFMTPPLDHENDKRELINCGHVPCSVILPREAAGKFNAGTVSLDHLAFIRMAVGHFMSQGRRRIAVITNLRKEDWWRSFNGVISENGAETRPYWNISVPNEAKDNVRNIANLMMQLPKDRLPDALLIADDNLAKPALAGMADSGSKALKNLSIVSHCNFPYRIQSEIPVKLLGYDSRHVVEAFMRALERQRNGEEPAMICEDVRPVFDN